MTVVAVRGRLGCNEVLTTVTYFKSAILISLLIINTILLSFLVSTNRIVANDEARAVSAGVSHWARGEFGLANDSPPLARMAAVLPLLPLNVACEAHAPGEGPQSHGSDARERELIHAGRFARINPYAFNFYCLGRMTGCLWWLVGAWVVFRCSGRLYGETAGCFGVILWSIAPNVLEQEQFATPALPAAVACAAATYAFRSYLLTSSWEKAFLAGVMLGVAQLVEFVSLTLLVTWPLLALIHRLSRGNGTSSAIRTRDRVFQVVFAIALGVWIINVGYGFTGSGSPLGSFDFASRALAGDLRPAGSHVGNRFRGTWLGRVVIPLPADYLTGIDRRCHERETAIQHHGGEGRLTEVEGDSLSRVTGKLPMGVWVMTLGSLILPFLRHPSSVPVAEELTLWLPAAAFLVMTTRALGPLSPTVGTLLATPFLIVIASKLAFFLRPGRWKSGWLAVVLSVGAVGECVTTSYRQFFTMERTALFRQDLVRQGRKLGLSVPEQGTSTGTGPEARGLLYRTFVDSRGTEMNYALFVPKAYRDDRPYPLILFLNGFGDRGTTAVNHKYTEVGLPFTLKYREIDFLVLCPQGQSGGWEAEGDDARRAMELLAAVEREYRVDPKRISLTGLSSGGRGVWNLAAQYPTLWAAIFPVAGSCIASQAPSVKDIPCWCFHNRYDGDIPVDAPRRMIEALRNLGGNPKYTEYPETGHRAWERAYVLPELYDWLERQRRP